MRFIQEILLCVTTVLISSTRAAPTSSDATPEDISAFENQALAAHNAARAEYGAGTVTWSDALYNGTKQWADQCKFQTSSSFEYGQNLAAGSGSFDVSDAVNLWMAGASKYDYDHPGFSNETGTFTQVVWKGTTEIACATAECAAGTLFPDDAATFVVCHYNPPGNVLGQFPQNVGRHI